MSEHISTFVSYAEGATRDIPPEQVVVSTVTELSREAFVTGVSSTQSVRDHIKVGPAHTAAADSPCMLTHYTMTVSQCVLHFMSERRNHLD